ncbi:hypothetical protein H0K98_001962 [Salmonella enterica]|nr:hypothetical protein [Salmonella enterica]
MKRRSADGSVGSPHARVGNCQASNSEEACPDGQAFLRLCATITGQNLPDH